MDTEDKFSFNDQMLRLPRDKLDFKLTEYIKNQVCK